MSDDDTGVTVYEAAGGQPFFDDVVARFYEGVEADPVLRPLYPDDLTDSKVHLSLFLAQYWGGPTTYSEQRGHPRLRMRHVPFRIGTAERDAWVRHMAAAVRSTCDGRGTHPEVERRLLDYTESAATFLVNAPD